MAFFVGQFDQSIDLKNRLTVPAAFRLAMLEAEQGLEFALVPVPGHYLWVFPAAQIERIMASGTPAAYQDASGWAFLAAMMKLVRADARGRVAIPAKMIRRVELGREVVLIGMGGRIEVWPRERWAQKEQGISPSFGEMVERPHASSPPTAADAGLGQAGEPG